MLDAIEKRTDEIGDDAICAYFKRQDNFTFSAIFKLMISDNHKPSPSHVDKATRRQLHLVPFTVTIAGDERDDQLAEMLREEWPTDVAGSDSCAGPSGGFEINAVRRRRKCVRFWF